jgi:hypothetical protein
MHTWQRSRLVAVAIVMLAALPALDTGPRPAGAAEPAPAGSDPLVELNQVFRQAYAKARQRGLDRAGPIILVEGDRLVLWQGGRREEVEFMPADYRHLKAVSHIPLAVYALLAPDADRRFEPAGLDELRRYRERLPAVARSLHARGWSNDLLQRQKQIVADAEAFLDQVLKEGKTSRPELVRYTRRQAAALLANAAEAARLQLEALHRQVSRWRASLSADQWKAVRVVVVGSAMPRQQNLSVQYFARLLGEAGEGRRIIYAESLWDEKRALDLLGTHLLDTDVGAAFFDDPRRMHRDLLADAARAHLEQMQLED